MRNWVEVLRFFALLLTELVVLFVVITFLIVLINRRIGPDKLKRWLAGNRLMAPLKGVTVGAITPFCSCSTIPMLVGMIRAGAPFAGVAAFLIVSPLVDPVILGLIGVMLGWKLMVGYAGIVILAAIVLGLLWDVLGLKRDVRWVRVTGCHQDEGAWRGLRSEAGSALVETVQALRKLVIPMIIGVGAGSIIHGAVPQSLIAGLGNGIWAVPVAALIGIPLYIRGTAALPIGISLMGAGVGVGPVFAMIIGGTGASLPEVSMLSGIFKPRLVGVFLASVFAVAVIGGYLLSVFA